MARYPTPRADRIAQDIARQKNAEFLAKREADRKQFEAAYAAKWKDRSERPESVSELTSIMLTMRVADGYHDGHGRDTPYLNNLWEGWQMHTAAEKP